MLTKLLKYDLKYMIKNMSIFYILGIISAILTRILFSLDQTFIVKLIGQISVGVMYSMIASILINVMMRSWVRFRDSIYKDEAYLTHTLPVSKNNIYDSKFLQTLIFFIISFIIVILCIFITYYSNDWWKSIKNLIDTITTGLNFNTALFVISFLSIIFLEIFNAIQCGFLGIILGYKMNNAKIGYSVLFGFTAYMIAQSIVLFSAFVVGLFNKSVMDLFRNNVLVDTNSFKILILISIIVYIVIITLMNLLCKKQLNKGVNIE